MIQGSESSRGSGPSLLVGYVGYVVVGVGLREAAFER
jgi:hypothetical protein